MKKIVFLSLVLTLVFTFAGCALSEDAPNEQVYVRGEIREAIDMTEEQLADIMN